MMALSWLSKATLFLLLAGFPRGVPGHTNGTQGQAALAPLCDAVISGMTLRLVGPFGGEDQLHGFTPIDGIRTEIGGIGRFSNDVSSDLGGIGDITDIEDIRQIGDITNELDHMNTVLETTMGQDEVENMREVAKIGDMKDLKSGFATVGSLGNGKRKQCSHPETFLPAVTGMTKIPAVNLTINFETTCPLPFGSYFRSIDGSCGHPKNLGAAFKPIGRILPPQYEDGLEIPRLFGVTGRPLPSPRVVSRNVHTDQSIASQFTIMLMQWGQFMDHDMVSTPLPIEDTRDTFTCCGPNKTLPLGTEDPECFPILFRGDDKFIGQCMEFVRSMPMMDGFGETLLPREHMNAVTAFVDASTVYGSSEDVLKELRTKHGQGHIFKLDDGKPLDNGKEDCIKREGMNDICYLAGDERINEHPGLTAIHTVFMRKHNQWAEHLRTLTPWMPDEMVFQKARAIVVAITQKIMYNDWLPHILGREMAVQSGIYTPLHTPSYFDENFDPSIFSAFSTAVFRFGHTLIPKEFFLGGNRREKLRDLFFKPYLLFEHFDEICINLVSGYTDDDRAQEFDRFITEEVTDHLFETQEGQMKGFDLIALNLQRARDHGLPGYNAYRELCGFHRIASFDDPVLGDAGPLFAKVYDHPDDIELFSGGISEKSFKGGVVGETFNCLITRQMRALKFGDRYFYSHDRGTHGFSPPQLRQIHKYTLSHLMCETTAITEIQIDAFRKPGYDNPVVPCAQLREDSLNLDPFAFMWG